jgi:MFS family permease
LLEISRFIYNRKQNIAHTLRAFKHYNYRLFFAGQGLSLIGTWMQQVAMAWLVYELTGSATLLGLVSFVSQIPNLVIMPFAGVLVDRFDRRRIILVTQTLSMLQATLLSVLVFTDTIQIWHIFALGLFLGLVNAVDMPARQAFVVKMVSKKEDLGSAIALNSAMFNGARLIGPTLAGLIIAAAGEKACFLVNAASYIAVIASLFAMKLPHEHPNPRKGGVLKDLLEGTKYTMKSVPIRSLLLLISFLSLIAMPYVTIMPVVAKTVLGGDSRTYGFLMGAVGVGALCGAMFLGSRKSYTGLWKLIPIVGTLFGAGLILASFSKTFWLTMALTAITGFGMMVTLASSNTLIQNIVHEDKRGRVMAFYSAAMMGTLPFGNLLMGKVVDAIGAPFTILAGGGLAILAAGVFSTQIQNLKRFSIEHAPSPSLASQAQADPVTRVDKDLHH